MSGGPLRGAMKTKKGLIELAAGGTVFLDEIGELPLSMQTKILTFLDHKKFKRVGGLEDIEVDARVIAATNRNLEHAVKQGEFREDLFYRINVMELVIPPLRDRREDIPALCDYYLKYYNGMFGKNITHVDPDFMRELLLYDWKGNVRELKNIFERCFLFCQGDVLEKHVELKRVDWKDDTRTGEPFAAKGSSERTDQSRSGGFHAGTDLHGPGAEALRKQRDKSGGPFGDHKILHEEKT